MCIHPEVSQVEDRSKVDSLCRELVSPWAREKDENKGCDYFEQFQEKQEDLKIGPGVFTLDDLRDFGHKNGVCPYYVTRRSLMKANVIVYNYSYMLDPKIANIVSAELQDNCIVIFDECHNIDNVCIEAFSINIKNSILDAANSQIKELDEKIKS